MGNRSKSEKPDLRPYKKHILICTGKKCAPEESSDLYRYLKDRLKELKHESFPVVQRSQCHCLGVCEGGPIVVVYPDGIWYHHVTKEILERILWEHVLNDRPIADHLFHKHENL